MSKTLRGAVKPLRAAAAESKVWNLIFPRGTWHGRNLDPIGGSITIDDEMLSQVKANWERAGRPPLPVRLTHQHLDAEVTPVERLELEKAYGLLTDVRVTAEGLEVLTEWTPKGAELVRAGEWNFWSPEWTPEGTDRRTGESVGWSLSGVALTNDPFFNSMPAVAASSAIPPGSSTGNQLKGKQMNPFAKIAAALGMPEDSTEEAVVQACSQMKAAFSQPQMQASLRAEVSKAIEPLQEQLKASAVELQTLKAENAKKDEALFTRDVEKLMADAKAEGFACDPMKEAISLVAKAKGFEEAGKLARSAAKLNLTTTGVPGSTGAKSLEANAQDYGAALDAFSKANPGLKGLGVIHAFHRANPGMAALVTANISK